MKAAVYTRYGSPEVLRIAHVARPEPKDNELLIRIHATTVTSGDVRLRKADPFVMRFIFGLFTPKAPILGHEVAGVVEAVGSKVTNYKVGDRVFGSTGMRSGTYAEYICIAEDGAIAHTPDEVAHGEAATLTTGALTALHFIHAAGLERGEHILIHGASGSIGTAAVQVTFSVSSSSQIDSPSILAPGITIAEPASGAEKASDQPLAWNIGTTGMMRSREERPSMSGWAATSEWMTLERCE